MLGKRRIFSSAMNIVNNFNIGFCLELNYHKVYFCQIMPGASVLTFCGDGGIFDIFLGFGSMPLAQKRAILFIF
mgnify:FL=1